MGEIRVTKKPEQQQRTADAIGRPLITFRVVKIDPHYSQKPDVEVEVGDVLVGLSGSWLDVAEILNTRTGKLLSKTETLLRRTHVVRDYSVQSVTLVFDDNELLA